MQPFVNADANAFSPLVQGMVDPLKRYEEQLAFKVGLDAEKANTLFKNAQVAAQAQKVQRQEQFATAMQAYLAHPTAQGLAQLLGQFPEYADEAKGAFGAMDADKQKTDLTQLGSIAAVASKGDYNKAAELMQARVDADNAAGQPDDQDKMVLDLLKSGDPAKQKQALGLLTLGIGVAAGPEHAKSFLEVQGLSQEPETGEVDGIVYDKNTGKPLFQSPYPRVISGLNGSFFVQPRVGTIPVIGGSQAPSGSANSAPTGVPADATDATGAVSSVFATAGLPSPVISGFLGNFHIEGGYTGKKGDGGKAAGIAQWRDERRDNFARVMGKPVEQATPQEQAQFVLYEMQHPEEAGMTVAQRDAILSAKTPQQAAALIDKYYERSSGKHRAKRMAAANAFADGASTYYGATHTATVDGKTYYQIDGQWYDNPEGK